MKIREILNITRPISCEFFPPKTAEGIPGVFRTIDRLKAFRPDFVSVTYGAGGSTRAFTEEITSRVKAEGDLEVMAHLTCVGQTKEALHSVLQQLDDTGIQMSLPCGETRRGGSGSSFRLRAVLATPPT